MLKSPFREIVKSQSFFAPFEFGDFEFFCGWYESSTTSESMHGREFV